jgi:hypothetical protein
VSTGNQYQDIACTLANFMEWIKQCHCHHLILSQDSQVDQIAACTTSRICWHCKCCLQGSFYLLGPVWYSFPITVVHTHCGLGCVKEETHTRWRGSTTAQRVSCEHWVSKELLKSANSCNRSSSEPSNTGICPATSSRATIQPRSVVKKPLALLSDRLA